MRKRRLILVGISLGLAVATLQIPVNATNTEPSPEITDYFTIIDEEGNPQIVMFDDIPDENDVENNYGVMTLDLEDENTEEDTDNRATSYKVVYLNAKGSDGNAYLTYNNVSNSGYTGYLTGSYAKDAAYIGTFNGKVRAMISGVVADFNTADVELVDYSKANISHYYESDGYLYHRFYYGTKGSYNSYRVGYDLDYLSEGNKYYSYDGHYFYTSYTKMIDDYQNNTRKNSINPNNPYYNYYQYLSHRSKTTITANQFNDMVINKLGKTTNSKMKDLGKYFIDYQNTYGVNALLMFGVAANESAWGTSNIAQTKNNLFGHGAVDSNPYYGANGYETPSDSIKYHAEKFISNGYLDSEDWRYNGGYLGDKASGINVRYASDPYHGEKNASIYYYNDTGLNDYGKYSIGVVSGVLKEYKLYKDASTSSKVVHTIGSGKCPRTLNHCFIVLDVVNGSDGKIWYKIQTDTALNSSRTDNDWDGQFNFSRDYVYVPSTNFKIVFEGENLIMKGDVNNNKKIDAADYLIIMDTILGKYNMSGKQKLAGDVNNNGKIDAADYLMIMDCILGKITIK